MVPLALSYKVNDICARLSADLISAKKKQENQPTLESMDKWGQTKINNYFYHAKYSSKVTQKAL